jgi:hypothetical protein
MKIMKGLAALIFIAIAVWVFFPASIPADTYASNLMPPSDFVMVKKEILEFSKRDHSANMISKGDPSSSEPIVLYCNDVPLIMLSNDAPYATLTVMSTAKQMYPETSMLVDEILVTLKQARGYSIQKAESSANAFDYVILKYREKIDIKSSCVTR